MSQTTPSLTPNQMKRAQELGRELLTLLDEPSQRLKITAKGADIKSFKSAVLKIRHNESVLNTLLQSRDASDPETTTALLDCADKGVRWKEPAFFIALTRSLAKKNDSNIFYELLKTVVMGSKPEEAYFKTLSATIDSDSLTKGLFLVVAGHTQAGSQQAWTETFTSFIEGDAPHHYAHFFSLAVMSQNWLVADILGPRCPPKILEEKLARLPEDALPASRSFLQRRELEQSVPSLENPQPLRQGPRI